jgi:hypothetical protein
MWVPGVVLQDRPLDSTIVWRDFCFVSRMRLYLLHGIDSTRAPAFGDVTGAEEINAVPHHHSVFQAILKQVPWQALDRVVAGLPGDWGCEHHRDIFRPGLSLSGVDAWLGLCGW